MSQRTSHTHCQSPASQRLNQSFAKECASPTPEEKLKISSPSKNKKYPSAQADRKEHEYQWKISLKYKNINGLQRLVNQRQLVIE
ncbi:hypothetical protein CLV93_1242 [Prolixibacter denitrificans]|nr:hypothetical protein CLV93_1242 [Prolixibacter denitrificans]